MKIIEALKRIKTNKDKITDLQMKIKQHSANLSVETPPYGTTTPDKIKEWAQSCEDTVQENISLLVAIANTNQQTKVTIELGGKQVTKTIAEWIWRRREYAAIDFQTWAAMTDRGLKEGKAQTSPGVETELKIIRHYDINMRDARMAMYKTEPSAIDATLEVINATTDLLA